MAGLQTEVVRAGAQYNRVRGLLLKIGVPAIVLAYPVAYGLAFLMGLLPASSAIAIAYEMAMILLVIGWLVACGVALWAVPLARAYRRLREAQLAAALERLPREEVAAVLLPLKDHPEPGTRAFVEPLLRRLRPEGTEVLPATGETSNDSEVSAPGE